jgi:hypothetical protein
MLKRGGQILLGVLAIERFNKLSWIFERKFKMPAAWLLLGWPIPEAMSNTKAVNAASTQMWQCIRAGKLTEPVQIIKEQHESLRRVGAL